MGEPEIVFHLAAEVVTFDDRWVRQRCAWCGVVLIDDDLSTIQVAGPDPRPPRGFERGSWIRVAPGVMSVFTKGEGANPDSCMALEFPRESPKLRLVKGDLEKADG